MKIKTESHHVRTCIVMIILALFSIPIMAQTALISNPLSNFHLQNDTVKEKKPKKKRDEFKVFGALNFNNLNINSEYYKPTTGLGWMLGGSYKRGRFFYWELGARYNRAVFNLHNANGPDTLALSERILSVSNVDVPITVGINFLSFISRIVELRVFVSAVPEIVVGINSNGLNITKDDLNSFNICGQAGVGVDVTFIYLEAGIDYGFMDLFEDYSPSNPIQGFITLGFRF